MLYILELKSAYVVIMFLMEHEFKSPRLMCTKFDFLASA